MTEAQAVILSRMAAGATLTQSCLGDRLWSLRDDPWTVFDDLSPRQLLAAGLIALQRPGSLEADRADAYGLTPLGHAALQNWRARSV
ncbi:hypothetical protein P7D22_17110 [Lichenihabitans sp. Uapishka_5]|uniref:hypothetical protein n=1 Tax=Lichenihabitans sp. Uapishka_5 TaxID=3037302 RepID=UPI0029E7F1A9|nr:hypothetical protein [Lichenihabitans sp. Uapishka_5]MDX7952887.1 hypothetical protein [Lichenihabitans sp. Uapishka_5]